jgi:maltose O-acetyltransferase
MMTADIAAPPSDALAEMCAGRLYDPSDPAVQAAQAATRRWLGRLNAAAAETPDAIRAILAERLAAVGRHVDLRPPFHCDYGFNITLGDGVFINFGAVILDVCAVSIGRGAQLGPGVHIYAADHPRDAATRRQGLEFGRPVRIGAHAWIGGGAIILPGITIGADAIVGAGAVVTRDVPDGATVAGNPARPVHHPTR